MSDNHSDTLIAPSFISVGTYCLTMSSPQITIGDLRIAIESNLTEVVKSYISYGEDPNQKIYGYGMLRIDDLALLSLRDYNHIPPPFTFLPLAAFVLS